MAITDKIGKTDSFTLILVLRKSSDPSNGTTQLNFKAVEDKAGFPEAVLVIPLSLWSVQTVIGAVSELPAFGLSQNSELVHTPPSNWAVTESFAKMRIARKKSLLISCIMSGVLQVDFFGENR